MIEARLACAGYLVPEPPSPLGAYVTSVRSGELLFVSGMLAKAAEPANAYALRDAAAGALLKAFAVIKRDCGSLDCVRRILRLAVFIAADSAFSDHAYVADGASELARTAFGEAAPHVRLAFGVVSLPANADIELDIVFEAASAC